MATDKNGAELKVDDLVTLTCRVGGINEGQGYDVAYLHPVEECGGLVHTKAFGVNAKQVELVAAPEAVKTKKVKDDHAPLSGS